MVGVVAAAEAVEAQIESKQAHDNSVCPRTAMVVECAVATDRNAIVIWCSLQGPDSSYDALSPQLPVKRSILNSFRNVR